MARPETRLSARASCLCSAKLGFRPELPAFLVRTWAFASSFLPFYSKIRLSARASGLFSEELGFRLELPAFLGRAPPVGLRGPVGRLGRLGAPRPLGSVGRTGPGRLGGAPRPLGSVPGFRVILG